MNYLTDEQLVEVYVKAFLLEFNPEFIQELENELNRRGINMNEVLNSDITG